MFLCDLQYTKKILPAGPILESKGMCAIFQNKGKKRAEKCLKKTKKGKVFGNLGKNVQNLKIF